MSDNTKISWADASWNVIIGCSKVSAGCTNCFAKRMACRLAYMGNRSYREVVCGILSRKDDPGEVICYDHWFGNTFFVESALEKPLHWKKPRKIFVCSMGDLFHESVPFEWVLKVLGIIIATPWHTYLILTKRPKRMYEFFAPYPDGWLIREAMKGSSLSYEFFAINTIKDVLPDAMVKKANEYWKAHYDQSKRGKLDGPVPHPIPNLHLGVTVENQDNVGRIEDLIRTPSAKRFVSFEPLLERAIWLDNPKCWDDSKKEMSFDYAFIGCESGPGARLCSLEDIRFMMMQCKQMGVKMHIKQLPLDGKCNKNFDEWPPEFQVREV